MFYSMYMTAHYLKSVTVWITLFINSACKAEETFVCTSSNGINSNCFSLHIKSLSWTLSRAREKHLPPLFNVGSVWENPSPTVLEALGQTPAFGAPHLDTCCMRQAQIFPRRSAAAQQTHTAQPPRHIRQCVDQVHLHVNKWLFSTFLCDVTSLSCLVFSELELCQRKPVHPQTLGAFFNLSVCLSVFVSSFSHFD